MAYESGTRTKILNAIRDAIAEIPALREVELQFPESAMPNAAVMPAVFVGRGTERHTGGTNMENRIDMGFHVIAYVEKAPEQPLEIAKIEIQESIESKLYALNTDSDFRNVATQLFIDTVDAGPLAVARLGYTGGVFPPYGAIRMDGHVDCFITAI